MLDPADTRFFKLLKKVCGETTAIDQACRDIVDRAISTGDPLDLRAARAAFDRLDPATKDAVLREVHRLMATDLSAIWDAMPGASGKQRPN